MNLRSKLTAYAYALENWTTDHYEKWPQPVQDWWDNQPDMILTSQLCRVFGHVAEKDHCGLPEHDCCQWCQKLLPFQAGDVPARMLKRLHWYLNDPEVSAQISEKLGEHGLNLKRSGH